MLSLSGASQQQMACDLLSSMYAVLILQSLRTEACRTTAAHERFVSSSGARGSVMMNFGMSLSFLVLPRSIMRSIR
jgi:hypothetical protein